MASRRGQFLRCLRQGLERTQPGAHGGNSGGGEKTKPARDGCRRSRYRGVNTKPPPPPPQVVHCPTQSISLPAPTPTPTPDPATASSCGENYFKRLPPEVIVKIFSYLDAVTLFCVGFVNRQFHELANDNVLWYELYSCEMGVRMWRPRLFETLDSATADVQDVPAAVWKKMLFSEMGYRKDAAWKKELRHVDLSTGMPEQTLQVLRSLRVVWEITLTCKGGRQSVYKQSEAFFTSSSVTVCWSGAWPKIHQVCSVQLHGVLGSPTAIPAKPQWRSLICKTLVSRIGHWRYIGADSLVKLLQFGEGITVGVWRGTWIIAFIMATLHFHRLVERSVLGSPFCPYMQEEISPLHADVPLGFSTHDYTVFVLLHNSMRRIMRCCYSSVLGTRDKHRSEFVQLQPVNASMAQKHTPILDKISFPWKAGKLQGDIKNCCMMTVSVLDEDQRPVWCISTSALLTPNQSRTLGETNDGEQFSLWYSDADGKLKMILVWMQDLQRYFVVSLRIWIRWEKLNAHFHKSAQDKF